MQEDPYAEAVEARLLELPARTQAEGAFERCVDLIKTDDELITKSREVIDLARRRLRQMSQAGTIYTSATLLCTTGNGIDPGAGS